MDRLATATVSTFRAVHAGFDWEKDAGVDGFLDLACKIDEAVEIIV